MFLVQTFNTIIPLHVNVDAPLECLSVKPAQLLHSSLVGIVSCVKIVRSGSRNVLLARYVCPCRYTCVDDVICISYAHVV